MLQVTEVLELSFAQNEFHITLPNMCLYGDTVCVELKAVALDTDLLKDGPDGEKSQKQAVMS